MEIVRTKDTGTLQYDIYLNEDQSECIVVERYRTPRRPSSMLRTLATSSGQSLPRSPSYNGEPLGKPSAELREKLAGGEVPVLFTPYQSM
jgi:hypothetical protein